MTDMSPEAVARRLRRMGELYVPETIEEGRARLEAERPATTESFADGARRRLVELRALDDLSRALQRAVRVAKPKDG